MEGPQRGPQGDLKGSKREMKNIENDVLSANFEVLAFLLSRCVLSSKIHPQEVPKVPGGRNSKDFDLPEGCLGEPWRVTLPIIFVIAL